MLWFSCAVCLVLSRPNTACEQRQEVYQLSNLHGVYIPPLRWRRNEHNGVSNHQPHDCLCNRLFGRRPKEISKLRVTGLCVGNSPVTGEFPAQRASNAENVSIWWRHHDSDITWSSRRLRSLLWCFFKSLFELTLKKASKVPITGPVWMESSVDRWTPHNGQ